MRFEAAREVVGNTPHTTPERGRQLYDHLVRYGARDVLELGFAHGVGTCYLAAAVHEVGDGRVTSIDRAGVLGYRPSADELVGRLGVADLVDLVEADTSYTWELMRLIERQTVDGVCEPCFDFVFVDGAHTWDVDGFAFFLVEKLLRPGGWILFDDLRWTFATSQSLGDAPWVQALPLEQRTIPQVAKVFELLVDQHPAFTDRRVEGNWGWARKLPRTARGVAKRVQRALAGEA